MTEGIKIPKTGRNSKYSGSKKRHVGRPSLGEIETRERCLSHRFNKHFRVYLLAIFMAAIFVSSQGGYVYGLAVAARASIVTSIEPGSMVSGVTYIVFTDGAAFFAKNGRTGEVPFSSANATEVANFALLGSVGGTCVFDGNLVFPHYASIPSNVEVVVTGIITLANGVNAAIFRNLHWGPTIVDWGITIRGGVLDGNEAGQTVEANDGCISLRGVANCTVESVAVKDFWGFAGIYVAGRDCIIRDNTVSGCVKTTGTYGSGIYLTGAGDSNNLVDGNFLIDNEGTGIFVEDYSDNNRVVNNYVSGNLRDGIWINLGCNNTISDNVVVGSKGVGGDRGIHVDQGNNNLVHGNRVSFSYYAGIEVSTVNGSAYASFGNILTDNIVTNISGGDPRIWVRTTGNTVTNNWLDGVQGVDAIATIASGNQVSSNSGSFVTEAWGFEAMGSSADVTVITHGLIYTPTAVFITFMDGNTTKYWFAPNPVTCAIHFVDTGTYQFGWYAVFHPLAY